MMVAPIPWPRHVVQIVAALRQIPELQQQLGALEALRQEVLAGRLVVFPRPVTHELVVAVPPNLSLADTESVEAWIARWISPHHAS